MFGTVFGMGLIELWLLWHAYKGSPTDHHSFSWPFVNSKVVFGKFADHNRRVCYDDPYPRIVLEVASILDNFSTVHHVACKQAHLNEFRENFWRWSRHPTRRIGGGKVSLHASYGFLNTRIHWWMQQYNWLKVTGINRQHNCNKNQGQGALTFTHQTKMIKASVGLDYFCLKCGLVLFSVWVKCSGGFLICFKQSLSIVSHWEVMKLVCFTQGHIVGGFSTFTEQVLFLWLVEMKVVCFMQIYLFGVCFWPDLISDAV